MRMKNIVQNNNNSLKASLKGIFRSKSFTFLKADMLKLLNVKPPFNLDGDLPSINWIITIGQLP